MLVYLDSNVYSRPLDNQASKRVADESEAFLKIFSLIEKGQVSILGSDFLDLEISMIENPYKRAEAAENLKIRSQCIRESEDVLALGEKLESSCKLGGRDALHIASAVLGHAKMFVTCDDRLIKKSKRINKTLHVEGKKISIINQLYLVKLLN